MTARKKDWAGTLEALNHTVADAAQFFAAVDESAADGGQTAREVIAHLVFWHREYVRIAWALVEGCPPELRSGSFHELNALAVEECKGEPLPALATRLSRLQWQLDRALRRLPNIAANFPVKQGGGAWRAVDRLPSIESHIRNHVGRLKRASRRENPRRV